MGFIRQLLWGAAICALGFAAIYFFLGRMPDPRTIDGGGPVPPVTAEPSQPAPTPAPAQTPVGNVGDPANAGLEINEAGLDIIKRSEGLRLEAYELSGRWYIGYGHSGATPGSTITEAEAEELLVQDVAGAEAGVKRLVMVPVNENQFSAMVSLAYNMGVGGFSRSSVLSQLNEGDYNGAADGFMVHIRSGYRVLEHLQHRREEERALFLTPVD